MSWSSTPAAVVLDGRVATGKNDGGTGAPPSNTAPDSCNLAFLPLRWGIDSLYLSYPGELADHREAELKHLKALAQSAPHEAARAQLAIDGHVFEVRDKSSGLFAFTLVDGSYMIRLSSRRSKKTPMAYVQVSSGLLAHKTVMEILVELRGILQALGDIEQPRVSRVDLFLDFCSAVDMEGWTRRAWVTKAAEIHQYAEGERFTGWTVGAGGVLMARLYEKSIESKKRGKDYLHGLWRQAGWDGEQPVWRLEFEFKRELLVQLGLDSVTSVLNGRAGLWAYATQKWLRLTIPSESDDSRSRWPVHPLWESLARIDWAGDGGPLLRSFKPTRAPGTDYLGVRALAIFASIAAVVGEENFEAAARATANLAWQALSRQNSAGGPKHPTGITQDQLFAEKVEGLSRAYNLRMNAPAADMPDADGPLYLNPYFRAKAGLRDL